MSSRAAFVQRNTPDCGAPRRKAASPPPPCRMDPGEYFCALLPRASAAAASGPASRAACIDWRWNSTVGRQLRARGGTPLVLRGIGGAARGYTDAATNVSLAPPQSFSSLLASPAVAAAPWVWIELPPNEVLQDWRASASATGNSEILWGAGNPGADGVAALARALAASNASCGSGGAALCRDTSNCPLLRCLHATFLHPTPSLQRAALPALSVLEAARSRGGAMVALHLRTGFADREELWRVSPTPSPAATAAALPAAATARYAARRTAWDHLRERFRPCASPGARGAAATVPPPQATWCFDTGRNPGLSAVIASGGACCGQPGARADWQSVQPLVFPPHEMAPSSPWGLADSLLACAANAAAAEGLHGPQQSGSELCRSSGQRGGGGWTWRQQAPATVPSAEAAAAAWLVYVAGDFPLVIAAAAASAAMEGHVLTAGAAGALGHVSSGHAARREEGGREEERRDPDGAWTRAVVDLFMLSLADGWLLAGSSSTFPGAANLRTLGSWPPERDLRFHFIPGPPPQHGNFRNGSARRGGEEGGEDDEAASPWDYNTWCGHAARIAHEDIEVLEAAGLGGSGV